MFLRQIQIRGFKSFADKTVLEFIPGVSVIVGPNGSGKSNLADAIAWVLGEQGPGALRGAQMADVVFAGSPARPALGMAEVTLVIDNEAGLIPVPDAEIEVGRVVYRSGESQYLVGGKPARLMDIQELLSDTGIGRALHTVVGQGQLEDVLVARPEERRQFIEEAAGIAKHRRRKDRAVRKLASLDQDLLRLQDVMAELKRRLRPLKQQAEAASRYEALQAEADDLAGRLAAARLRDLYAERDRGRPGWEEGRVRRSEAERRLRTLDAEIASLTERLAQGERALTDAEASEAEAARDRVTAEGALRGTVRAEGESRARLAEEDTRALERDLESTTAGLRHMEEELRRAEAAFAEADRRRREAEEGRRLVRERATVRRAEVLSLRRSLELSRSEGERLRAALGEVRRREAEAQRERDDLEEEVERLDARSTPGSDRLARLHRESDRLTGEAETLDERRRDLEGRRQSIRARRDALAETPGRRFLRPGRGHALGLLADLIRVDAGYEKAAAAALGPLADAVVYQDHARAVVDAAEAAGATLAVADEGHGRGFVLPGERPLLSAVHADRGAAAVVAAALRHVYLARDRDDALAKHRRHRAASFVTPDGLLVGPAVVRTAPAPSEEELDLRKREVAADRELAVVGREVANKRRALARAAGERASVEEALRRADVLITAAADRMARMDADLAALRREREVLEQRLAGVQEHVGSATEALGEGAEDTEPPVQELPPPPEPPMALQVEVETLRRELGRLEQLLGTRRDEARRLREHDPDALRADLERATAERERAEAALRTAEEHAQGATARREEAARTVAELRASETEANRGWREAAESLQRLRDEYEEQEQARRDIDRRVTDAERVLREGHGRDPSEGVAELGGDDKPGGLPKRSVPVGPGRGPPVRAEL